MQEPEGNQRPPVGGAAGLLRRLPVLPRKLANALRLAGRSRSLVGYVGWLGFENLGDEALFLAISNLLRPAALFPYAPTPFEMRLLRSLKPDKTFRALCLGGGTLIGRSPYLKLVQDALASNTPVFSFGTGVLSQSFWRQVDGNDIDCDQWRAPLAEFAAVSVRGRLSAALLERMGIENAQVVGDPVLALAGDTLADEGEDLVLGVNIGHPGNGCLWGGSIARVVNAVAGALRLLAGHGWRFRLFGVWPGDRAVIRRLAQQVGGAHIESCRHYADPHEFIADAGKCCVFLGMKLHATVLAYCSFTPVVMLEYRPKCMDFMESVGRADYSVRTDRLEAPDLAELVERARSQRDRLRREQFLCCQEYKSRLRAFAVQVRDQVHLR